MFFLRSPLLKLTPENILEFSCHLARSLKKLFPRITGDQGIWLCTQLSCMVRSPTGSSVSPGRSPCTGPLSHTAREVKGSTGEPHSEEEKPGRALPRTGDLSILRGWGMPAAEGQLSRGYEREKYDTLLKRKRIFHLPWEPQE